MFVGSGALQLQLTSTPAGKMGCWPRALPSASASAASASSPLRVHTDAHSLRVLGVPSSRINSVSPTDSFNPTPPLLVLCGEARRAQNERSES